MRLTALSHPAGVLQTFLHLFQIPSRNGFPTRSNSSLGKWFQGESRIRGAGDSHPREVNGTAKVRTGVTPKLFKPFLFIPGGEWSERAPNSTEPPKNPFVKAAAYLCRGGNNTLVDFPYSVDREAEFIARHQKRPGNIFTMRFLHPMGELHDNARQIASAIACIRRLAGLDRLRNAQLDRLDVFTDCYGFWGLRQYLYEVPDEQNSHVDHWFATGASVHGWPFILDAVTLVSWMTKTFHLPVRKLSEYEVSPETIHGLTSLMSDLSWGPIYTNKSAHRLNSSDNLKREREKIGSLTLMNGKEHRYLEGILGRGIPFFLSGDGRLPNKKKWNTMPYAETYSTGNKKDYENLLKKMLEKKSGSKRRQLIDFHKQLRGEEAFCAKIVERVTGADMPWELGSRLKHESAPQTKGRLVSKAPLLAGPICYGIGIALGLSVCGLAALHKIVGWPREGKLWGHIEIGPNDRFIHPKNRAVAHS